MKTILRNLIILVLVILLAGCADAEALPGEALNLTNNESASGEVEAADVADMREALAARITYPVVDTGQEICFDNADGIACPGQEEAYYGQDAQYSGLQPAYADNGDGTVTDLNTGLMWMQDAGKKVTYFKGIASVDGFSFAGYDDWRVPTIKEL